MLKSGCIKSEIMPSDGKRISVMSRHTLSDGITPDPQITKDNFNEWMPELAPPAKLIGSYYKRGKSWAEFENEYVDFLRNPAQKDCLQKLINTALEQTVTVLCVETTPQQCHRRLLLVECKLTEPSLETYLR